MCRDLIPPSWMRDFENLFKIILIKLWPILTKSYIYQEHLEPWNLSFTIVNLKPQKNSTKRESVFPLKRAKKRESVLIKCALKDFPRACNQRAKQGKARLDPLHATGWYIFDKKCYLYSFYLGYCGDLAIIHNWKW